GRLFRDHLDADGRQRVVLFSRLAVAVLFALLVRVGLPILLGLLLGVGLGLGQRPFPGLEGLLLGLQLFLPGQQRLAGLLLLPGPGLIVLRPLLPGLRVVLRLLIIPRLLLFLRLGVLLGLGLVDLGHLHRRGGAGDLLLLAVLVLFLDLVGVGLRLAQVG